MPRPTANEAAQRLGNRTVLLDFLEGISPEEIAVRYRSLTLEQVYAPITYYLQQRDAMDAYLQAYQREDDAAAEQQSRQPNEVVRRLRAQDALSHGREHTKSVRDQLLRREPAITSFHPASSRAW